MHRSRGERLSIEQHIHQLLYTFALAMGVVIGALVLLFLAINRQYENVLENANTAAAFNTAFKDTIDSEMYDLVIRPWRPQMAEGLPLGELDAAETVLRRLETTTTLPDNRWRLRSMLNMCENLRGYMLEIADTQSYDARMELLERNIRGETGLTVLIETYMHAFLDDEVRELARLQGRIRRQSIVIIAAAAAGVVLILLLALATSMRTARSITGPIGALSQKAQRFGEGDFTALPVETDIAELNTLDRGFDDMAGRIRALMARQMEDERSLHRAELELLQAQINPHFLYNTLDSIVILAESQRNEDVVDMVTSLSQLFRVSLSEGQDIISLAQEREHVRSYLEIQQVRYSDILRYAIDIPEALLSCRVPKLILQPLVENALYHGIKNRRGPGMIRVTGERAGDVLRLTVEDNGVGLDEEALKALRESLKEGRRAGHGLCNVHRRIRLYGGEDYGLSIESTPGRGTRVTASLPMELEEAQRRSVE